MFDPFAPAAAPVIGPNGSTRTQDACSQLAHDRYRVLGRELALPMHIADFTLLAQVFTVPIAPARALLERVGLRPAEVLPGMGALSLLALEYRDNPLGNYREAAILVAAHAPGYRALPWFGGLDLLLRRAGHYVHAMPVDQEFTTHAGRGMWGYPKFLAELELSYAEQVGRGRFAHDGKLVFALQAPISETGSVVQPVPTFTWGSGRLRRIDMQVSARGVGFRLGGTPPEIGDEHELARTLRAFGLPKRPLCSLSLRHASADMGIADELVRVAAE
jgi:hypothetical protein